MCGLSEEFRGASDSQELKVQAARRADGHDTVCTAASI